MHIVQVFSKIRSFLLNSFKLLWNGRIPKLRELFFPNILEKNYQVTKIVSGILDIVRLYYGTVADEDSVSYNRFVTHIQYFAQRVINGVIQGVNDNFLYEQVKLNYPEAFSCSDKIKNYIENTYDFSMSRDEQVYITIHIQRLETS